MSKAERRTRRANRRTALRAALGRIRPLDEDDREALVVLIKRASELLGDGERSDADINELRELINDLAEARANTPESTQ